VLADSEATGKCWSVRGLCTVTFMSLLVAGRPGPPSRLSHGREHPSPELQVERCPAGPCQWAQVRSCATGGAPLLLSGHVRGGVPIVQHTGCEYMQSWSVPMNASDPTFMNVTLAVILCTPPAY
jgi:hypothetical protein